MATDNLSFDMNAALAEMNSEAGGGPAPAQDGVENGETDLGIPSEVEDSFEEVDLGDSQSESSKGDVVPQTIKFKGDGEEEEIVLDEQGLERVQKALSLEKGARRAFSQASKLRKELKAVQDQMKEMARYKEAIDNLERLKENPEELAQRLGLDEYYKNRREREERYATATDEERAVMERDEQIEQLRREIDKIRQVSEKSVEEANSKIEQAETKEMYGNMESAFKKVEFHQHIDDPDKAEALNEQLWYSSIARLKKLDRDGYQITPKVIERVFQRKADAVLSYIKSAADKQADDVINKASEEATKSVQAAAKAKTSATNGVDDLMQFAGSPIKLWQKMTQR